VRGWPLILVLGLFLLGCGHRGNRWLSRKRPVVAQAQSAQSRSGGVPAKTGPSCLPVSFSDLAAAADPSVVQVRTRQEMPSRSGRRRLTGEGLGSAFVYDSNGLVLTNHHVVVDASEIRIVFKDGRDFPAEIVGADPPTDVAILRVAEHSLPALPLGNSDELRVGDWVLAIGNPFGLSHTVSAGIVSARGRTIRDLEGLGDGTGYFDFLQTDASINPGNSGGPLIDVNGRVVGISTAIRAHSNKIGFAIPINMVREIIPVLVSSGHVRRSALGVRVDFISANDIRRLQLGTIAGTIVRAVQPQSGADKAGFRVDDIIVEFQSQPIVGPERLRWLASMAGVNQRVTVKIQRHNRIMELTASLGELPASSSPFIDESEDQDE
jgi:serine protease Do